MSILTGYLQKYTNVKAVGLCHSVQVCVPDLFKWLELDKEYDVSKLKWNVAGINHMAWLTEIKDENFNYLYPVIKKRIEEEFANLDKYN